MSVIDLNAENFDTTIQASQFVLVDFWADWCEPCKNFAPVYDEVSNQFTDIVFARVDADVESELASHFNVRSIPCLLVFREQIIIGRFNQALTKSELTLLVEKAGALDMAQIQQDARHGE